MTRRILPIALFVLTLFAFDGCKKDSSHSHGDGTEHSHDGDDHGSDKKKPADPPTKEVPVPDAGGQGTAAKQPAAVDAAVRDADKESEHDHDHGKGEHEH